MNAQDESQSNRHVPLIKSSRAGSAGVSRDGHRDKILTALEEAASQIYLPVTE